MADGNGNQSGGKQVRVDASQVDTIYANAFAITGAAEEMTIYLGVNAQFPGNPQPVMKMSHRLVLLPTNAKRLMQALGQTIQAHEKRFGQIDISGPQRGAPG